MSTCSLGVYTYAPGLEDIFVFAVTYCMLNLSFIDQQSVGGGSYVFNLQLLGIELCTNFVYQTNNHRVTVWLLTWRNNTWNNFENTEPVLSHWLIICLAIEISCGRVARGYGICWRLRQLPVAVFRAGEARNMTENRLSILIVIFPYNSNKLRPQTESCAVAQTP